MSRTDNYIICANLVLLALMLLGVSSNSEEQSFAHLRSGAELWLLTSGGFVELYGRLSARRSLYRLNHLLYRCAIRGLGCLHWENFRATGEDAFVRSVVAGRDNPLTVFDVGAYHGDYAKLVRHYSPTAQIYCFEPHPRSYQKLQEAAQTHNLVTLDLACAERSGKAVLFDLAENDGSLFASLHREMFDLHLGKPSRAHDVDAISIDEFAETRGIERINLLKIDTEGAELDVLKGASALIQAGRIDAVQFEFSTRFVLRRTFVRDFCELLVGYKFFRLLPNELLPLGPYSVSNYELFHYQHLVALLDKGKPPARLGTGRARLADPVA
jgi:FkbM family methyltransferase